MSLVHLHCHGSFSLLDGLGKEDERAKRAADLGQGALALTDHGTLSGVLYHAEACHEVGIKPIVGIEAYFREDIQKDRDDKNQYGYNHLVLLAKNWTGFKNLMHLSSMSYTPGYYYQKPSIDWKLLEGYSEGLIASSSCISGLLPKKMLQGDTEGVEESLKKFQSIFGEDFYLETQPHDIEEQRLVNIEMLNLAMRTGVPVVATSDVHYPFKGWEDTQLVSIKINAKDWSYGNLDTTYLMSEEELTETFKQYHPDIPEDYIDEMVTNSAEIAERCEDFHYDKKPKIPKATTNALEAESILREWCVEGLGRIGKESDQVYRDRLETELDVIKKLKTADYFIIVGDMVRWAKDQGIRVGPGRGSAAGSLVNYLVGITAIDPIGYDLLFERFLNEDRTELPDIDIDFQDDRRDEVKQYLVDKWGSDYVVDVAAFQSFGLKGAIKDVCRVLEVPYVVANNATKDIPDASKTFGDDLESIEKKIPAVKALFTRFPDVKKHAVRLLGNMRGISKHAAAVIITDRPADELIPTMMSKDGGVVTQWSERANAQLISPYGFLKIDCLSTDALTTQKLTIDLIKERHNIDVDFEDPKQFPVIENPLLVDKAVINTFTEGSNLGIFQFSSKGISGLLKAIKPTNLEHLIAANALYRPGTLENNVAFEYSKRKNGINNWKVPHISVAEFLNSTYGFMIFQEQVMQIFRELARDATPAEAAVFMKVVSKGIARDLEGKKRLQKYRDKFVDGCSDKGIPEKTYNILWDQILQMSTYSFNKCAHYGTKITLPDGKQMRLCTAYKKQPKEIMAMWPDGEIRPHKVLKIVKTGVKPLYKVRTKSQRGISATKEHRILTTDGYKQISDLKIGDELITSPLKISESDRKRRIKSGENMHGQPWSKERDKRTSKKMKEYQKNRGLEEQQKHMKLMHEKYPEMKKIGILAMQEKNKWLWANDPEWRLARIADIAKGARKFYDSGPGFGNCSIASNGMFCASNNERDMCEWLISLEIDFQMHKPIGNGRICDYYFSGIYWEMDGMDRTHEYFEKKYGDLPFVVVTPEDYKFVVEKHLHLEHAENGDPIVSIKYIGEHHTYDIEMDPDGPLNWIANTIVSHNSHSAGYAIQAYQDTWLKHYYPLEFYSALLTTETDKISEIIRESRSKGIKILPPDVNTSKEGFTIDNNNIRFGLLGIKNIGPAAVIEIQSKGPFTSIADLLEKCEKRTLNKTRLKALYYSGALDKFDARKKWIYDDEEGLIPGELDETTLFEKEKEYVGFSTSRKSDIDTYKSILDDMIQLEMNETDEGQEVIVGGEVTDVKVIQTKKGEQMAFVTLDYFNNDFSLTVFPELYKRYNHMFGDGNTLLAMGKWDEERQCVTVNNICTAEQLAIEMNGG